MAAIASKRIKGVAAILIAFAFAAPGPLRAESAATVPPQARPSPHRSARPAPTPSALPANVKAKISVYKPGTIPFHDGEQLVFEASWVGIPVAQARFELRKKTAAQPPIDSPPSDPAHWTAEAWVETNAFADLFYKMRDYVREEIATDTLRTGGIYIVQHENKRLNFYDVTIDRAKGMVTQTKKNHKGTLSKQFISAVPWGPLSGSMMALTQPLAAGKTYNFDVFAGGQRYVFSFVVDRRERISTPLGDFDAWRVVPDILYLSDGNLRGEARGTTLWVSADDRHLPLRIQSEAFIGYVRADLISVDGHGIAN